MANKRTGEPRGSCGRGRALERGALTQLSAPNLGPPSSRGRVAGPGVGLGCMSREPEGLCSTLQSPLPPIRERTARRRWAGVWGRQECPPQLSLGMPRGRRHLGPCAEPPGSSTLLRVGRASEARESRCPCPGWSISPDGWLVNRLTEHGVRTPGDWLQRSGGAVVSFCCLLPPVKAGGFSGSSAVKNPPATKRMQEVTGSTPGLGRCPEGHGNPRQDSCPEDPQDRGAWRAAVHGIAKSRTRLK